MSLEFFFVKKTKSISVFQKPAVVSGSRLICAQKMAKTRLF